MIQRVLLLSLLAAALAGCSWFKPGGSSAQAAGAQQTPVMLPSRVTAVGYGALPNMDGYTMAQRRLLAMRASKLDALRALAETVHGVRITGQSTVAALTLQNDSFRYYIDAYLRGARVLTINPLPDGAYETVVELQLSPDFYRDAGMAQQGLQIESPRVDGQPNPDIPSTAPAATAPAAQAAPVAPQPVSVALPANNFYYAR
ncbi:LPP20 family lipoprotein [Andreprevotia chitinilytica]|uniref:LPP20 family lipoprotein n=1 Tax=Andreprevotia chitinilytica TaxID=396808 RepID=UPI00068D8CDF|nr:LPP20 family lipoprotein [Andreprevotia chitinilytica]